MAGSHKTLIAGTAANLEDTRALMNKIDPMPQVVILDVSMGSGNKAAVGEINAVIDAILAGGTYTSVKIKIQDQKEIFLALTWREKEIVSLVKQSLSNQQIIKMLGLSNRTMEI